nr:hypothetical protein [uncultured Flavobacterium sp.]
MNFKDILLQIQNKQLETFCLVPKLLAKNGTELLPRNHRGLYWIWTRLSIEQLKNTATRINTMEVPIEKLINQREQLNNICKVAKNDFRIVYNGIGGYRKTKPNFGLRERILQELNCMDHRTGTLNILNRNFNESDWGISFFDFDDPNNLEIINKIKSDNPYVDYAGDLETLWRLEFGHPILCRY